MPRKSVAAERRRELIPPIAALFDSRGYHLVSVNEAARVVGLSKAALYHYFKGKESILYAIHDEFMRTVTGKIEQRIASQPPVEALCGSVGDVVSLYQTHPGYVRIFLEHHRELAPADRKAIQKKRQKYGELVLGIVRAGIASGDFRDDLDPEMIVRNIFGMCAWPIQWWEPDDGPELDAVVRSINAMVLGGIATAQGRRRGRRHTSTGARIAPVAENASISSLE